MRVQNSFTFQNTMSPRQFPTKPLSTFSAQAQQPEQSEFREFERNAGIFDNPLPRIDNPYSGQDARQHEIQNFETEQNALREMEQTHLLGVPSGFGRTFTRVEAQ